MKQNIIELKLDGNYNPKEETEIYGLKCKIHGKDGNLYHVEFYESKEKVASKLGKLEKISDLYCSAYYKHPIKENNEKNEERRTIIDEGLDEIISKAIHKLATEESFK